MTEFDRVSHELGRIAGKLEEIEKAQKAQWEKIDRVEQTLRVKLEKIEQTLTAHRIKVAGLAGGISVLMTLLLQWFKKIFTGGQ